MNTIRSTWYGWATLCVAGGGAYYFAKRQINEDRANRYNKEREKQERLHRLEYSAINFNNNPTSANKKVTNTKDETEPHSDGNDNTETQSRPRSKYEGEPFRSRKGDRFS